jgi:hypothetical protein
LKDDRLVKVDYTKKHNYLRQAGLPPEDPYVLISGDESRDISQIKPEDAAELQPVDIESHKNKQFWVTVRVPDHIPGGNYKGKLMLRAENVPNKELTINIHVLPFTLEKPALRYAIYYRGRISLYPPGDSRLRGHRNINGVINSNWKSPTRYLAELENMKAHGVEYPTIYQNDEKLFQRELDLRKKAGLPMGSLYSLGVQTGNSSSVDSILRLQSKVKKWKELGSRYDVREFYVYGIDEAKGDMLLSQRIPWSAVREAGGKVFAAIEKGKAAVMGEYLDTAIVPGFLESKESFQYHAIGKQVFSYSNPQVGVEDPDIYRRNYGVRLWRAGYDGAMNYAYQHSANHIWNDFDDNKYRDHVFAYPTVNGVIDTIQFEGFREGIDDVRYLTTLASAIKKASSSKLDEAAEAQNWIDRFDPDKDTQEIRSECVGWIMRLLGS